MMSGWTSNSMQVFVICQMKCVIRICPTEPGYNTKSPQLSPVAFFTMQFLWAPPSHPPIVGLCGVLKSCQLDECWALHQILRYERGRNSFPGFLTKSRLQLYKRFCRENLWTELFVHLLSKSTAPIFLQKAKENLRMNVLLINAALCSNVRSSLHPLCF